MDGGYINLAFSPAGNLLASWNSDDNIIRVWDLITGKETLRLPADEKRNFESGVCFAWSPDGRTLAVAGRDIQIWELASLKVRCEFPGHKGVVRSLAYSPNGRQLASGSNDTTVLLWDAAHMEHLASSAKSLKPNELVEHWQSLSSDDAAKAFNAIRELTASPREAVSWIRERVKPATVVAQGRIDELIGQLDSEQFKVRQNATSDMLKIGEPVLPAIDKALANQPTLETRQRLEGLKAKLTSVIHQGERLLHHRAIEVLERIGTPEACQVLQGLAEGAPGALVTTQARTALERLEK